METKDRTQASYNLVDINEQTRIAFEKCKETREQKIERLKAKIKKEKWWYNQWNKTELSFISGCMKQQIKQTIVKLEQQIKELEDDGRNSKNEKV